MMRKTIVALALSAGVIASGSAFADPAKFDGTWSVSLGVCRWWPVVAYAAAGPVRP